MTSIRNILSKIINTLSRFVHPLKEEERKEVIEDIRASASPSFDFYLLVILSCSIATLGLITDSAAVIIGAMLLAPLMSPIIGIGLASITGDEKLIKTSAYALLVGTGLAIALSFFMTLVNRLLPFVALQELPGEVLARTRPSPIDLLIALAGGLAAAYALTRPNLSATLPGVAIATALMPPLCTIGVGMALNRWDVAGGATLLFTTNLITIAFASALVFFIRGFSAKTYRREKKIPRSLVISLILVVALLVPLSFISIRFFREATENRLINTVVSEEIAKFDGAQLTDINVVHQDTGLEMVISVRTSKALFYEEVVAIQEAIVAGINAPVSLKVEQVISEELDPLIPPTPTPTATQTLTPTPGPSATPTASPTPTATGTPTFTPTPGIGEAGAPEIPPLYLYQEPGGPTIGYVWYGQQLTILNERQEYGGYEWVQVMDSDARVGWIPEIYLTRITFTPTP